MAFVIVFRLTTENVERPKSNQPGLLFKIFNCCAENTRKGPDRAHVECESSLTPELHSTIRYSLPPRKVYTLVWLKFRYSFIVSKVYFAVGLHFQEALPVSKPIKIKCCWRIFKSESTLLYTIRNKLYCGCTANPKRKYNLRNVWVRSSEPTSVFLWQDIGPCLPFPRQVRLFQSYPTMGLYFYKIQPTLQRAGTPRCTTNMCEKMVLFMNLAWNNV